MTKISIKSNKNSLCKNQCNNLISYLFDTELYKTIFKKATIIGSQAKELFEDVILMYHVGESKSLSFEEVKLKLKNFGYI